MYACLPRSMPRPRPQCLPRMAPHHSSPHATPRPCSIGGGAVPLPGGQWNPGCDLSQEGASCSGQGVSGAETGRALHGCMAGHAGPQTPQPKCRHAHSLKWACLNFLFATSLAPPSCRSPAPTNRRLHACAQPAHAPLGDEASLHTLRRPTSPPLLAHSPNHLQVALIHNVPLFFQIRDGHWFPNLHVLHAYPDMMPKLRTDEVSAAQWACGHAWWRRGAMDMQWACGHAWRRRGAARLSAACCDGWNAVTL